jgi:hypothetical protein
MLRLSVAAALAVLMTGSAAFAGPDDLALVDRHGGGADYRLPYGTYTGGYANWRTYGVVGNRVAQYGPLSNKQVPRWEYNVRTGEPSGFDLKTR